ncbi:hypothetical protein ASC80_01685 [Afipia sp. Root123D2]|uniref:HNH endonuclease n=1 Tax=Afipia sp. Root123D2 TaxID=1736436 RepID=UPI0006F6D1C3|nr:HNH endonuclease [Afipia sp. Root123D2]KQW22134.1 hypothetical protein ASC80_01685 [Afipia sp. Root123D2]
MNARVVDLAGTPYCAITLSVRDGIWCLVDAIDYPWLAANTWNVSYGSRTRWQLYAKRNIGRDRATVRMHREIMMRAEPLSIEEAATLHVDHINGQTLDNRRVNLRWATRSENARNTRPRERIPSLDMIVGRLLAGHSHAPMMADVPF